MFYGFVNFLRYFIFIISVVYVFYKSIVVADNKGAYKEWYKSGRKKSLKHFKNGKENGIRKEWSEDGKKTYEANFVDGNEE